MGGGVSGCADKVGIKLLERGVKGEVERSMLVKRWMDGNGSSGSYVLVWKSVTRRESVSVHLVGWLEERRGRGWVVCRIDEMIEVVWEERCE